MTPKGKRIDHKAEESPRAGSEDAAAGAEETQSLVPVQGTGQEPEALAFGKEPAYRELLQHFQNAEWEKCLLNIERLLETYPNDEHLLAFKQDVQIRSQLQESSDTRRELEDHQRRRKFRRRVVIAILSGIIVGASAYWFLNAYQTEETRQSLAAQATQTAEALAAKASMADTLMRAGRAQEALPLYAEIQKQDPTYEGIGKDLEAAQLAVKTEDLYQQGKRALEAGDSDQALKLLQQVEALLPQYKDAPQLIAQITRDQEIAKLVAAVQDAYAREDSAGVIRNYEAIQAIDPFFDNPDLHEALFASYRELVLEIAARPSPTLEDIKTAAKYYRNALALFPQSLEHARELAELEQVAVDLLASQDYLQGISLLESSDYSIQGIQQSTLVLQRARQKGPQSPAVDAAIQKAQSFIDAYDSLVHGGWDKAITGLESIYGPDPNFADGRVRYFLYEAYTSRGDLLMSNGDFGGAFADYQAAEKFAFADEGNVLRVFQIEVRVASALRRMGRYDQAAEFYHYAFQQVAYEKRLTKPEQKGLLAELREADSVYAAGDKFKAIGIYEATLDQTEQLYELSKIAALQGDTLPNLAFENGSTIWSLRNANDLGDRLIISRSQELSVPVLPALP